MKRPVPKVLTLKLIMAETKKVQVVEENDLVNKASGFWEQHGRKVLIAAGVILALLIAFIAYKELVSKPNNEKAADALFRAQEYFSQDSVRLALNGDNINPGFLKIISRYDGTPSANLAH